VGSIPFNSILPVFLTYISPIFCSLIPTIPSPPSRHWENANEKKGGNGKEKGKIEEREHMKKRNK
jgi:hypothetical protein